MNSVPHVATGVYGNGARGSLLRIAHIGEHQLWNQGVRFPITQGIGKCASFGLFGVYVDGIRGKGYSVSSVFLPWVEENFANYRLSDVKTSKRGSEPHTISMSERSAKLQS